MSAHAGAARPAPRLVWVFGLGALAALGLELFTRFSIAYLAILAAFLVLLALSHRIVLRWRSLLGLTIAVIVFIPIRRYSIGGGLPLQLEPYRIIVAIVSAGWLVSLLVDPRVRLRRSGFEVPLLLVFGSVLASVVLNSGRIHELGVGTEVVKKLMFFISFLFVFYLVTCLAPRLADLDRLLTVLVTCGTVVAALALVEYRTGTNLFNHLQTVLPILHKEPFLVEAGRGGKTRAYASAEHPIALGAMLLMLIPLAVYLARRSGKRRWLWCTGLHVLGAMATLSRTSVLMLITLGIVFVWLRPAVVKRLWKFVIIALILSKVFLPGSIGTIRYEFNPSGGILHQQSSDKGGAGQGRVADLGPSLAEYSRSPLFGEGYGTRITGGPNTNAQILDDQWLKTLLETGLLGFLGWLTLLGSFIYRLGRAARADHSVRGWFLVGLTASIAAYAVGMLTYDAFSFIQGTFVLFLLMAFGASLLRQEDAVRRLQRAPVQQPPELLAGAS